MRKILIVAILLIGIVAGLLLAGFSPVGMIVYQGKNSLDSSDFLMIPHLSLEGFSEAAVDVDDVSDVDRTGDGIGFVYLYSGCRRIVMLTSEDQVMSIRNGLEGKLEFRPSSHDTMKNVFDTFGMDVILVKITHMENDVYFARLFLVQGTRILNLDSKPTDAIAIALRSGAPIFVSEDLLEQQGEKVC